MCYTITKSNAKCINGHLINLYSNRASDRAAFFILKTKTEGGQNMRYKEWLAEWLEHYVKPSTKVRTYERYKGLMIHIVPKIGEHELNELTPFALQQLVSDLLISDNQKTGRGLSPNTVNAVISVVQNSLKAAFAVGLAEQYTADKIKRPRVTEKRVECFSHNIKCVF